MSATPPSTSGTVMCQRRSLARLELQAVMTCASIVTRYSASVISAMRDAWRACRRRRARGVSAHPLTVRCERCTSVQHSLPQRQCTLWRPSLARHADAHRSDHQEGAAGQAAPSSPACQRC